MVPVVIGMNEIHQKANLSVTGVYAPAYHKNRLTGIRYWLRTRLVDDLIRNDASSLIPCFMNEMNLVSGIYKVTVTVKY